METDYLLDEVFGERLLISQKADKSELSSNVRAARAILSSYSEVCIRINAHTYCIGHKNPEYTICEELGDRKGVMSEKGITAGFKSAKRQGCKIVVIDLDEHVMHLDSFSLRVGYDKRFTGTQVKSHTWFESSIRVLIFASVHSERLARS